MEETKADARAIADRLEQDVYDALHRKYGENPDPLILKRLRQEWTGLLEVDAVSELAAAYELSQWLNANAHPYYMGGYVDSGLIPYLLDIKKVNPLPQHLYCPNCRRVIWWQDGAGCCECGAEMITDGHDLVWHEYSSYGRVPDYVFHLPRDLEPQIPGNYDRWENLYFLFDAEHTQVPEIPALCREDIFFYLKRHGFVDKDAFRGMCSVCKGRGFPVTTDEMRTAEDSWILRQCEGIGYLPSRANLLEQLHFTQQLKKSG